MRGAYLVIVCVSSGSCGGCLLIVLLSLLLPIFVVVACCLCSLLMNAIPLLSAAPHPSLIRFFLSLYPLNLPLLCLLSPPCIWSPTPPHLRAFPSAKAFDSFFISLFGQKLFLSFRLAFFPRSSFRTNGHAMKASNLTSAAILNPRLRR